MKRVTRPAPQAIALIPTMRMSQLLRLWNNAARLSAKNKKTKKGEDNDAVIVIREIESEWRRRGANPPRPEDYFDWPSPEADRGDGRLTNEGWVREGVLSYMGYRVGRTDGVDALIRRRILELVFEGPLPPVFPPLYLEEWGGPNSAARLKKMAETIAALSRNAKRKKSAEMRSAVLSWDQDLSFLYENFYIDRFRFAWPTSRIDIVGR